MRDDDFLNIFMVVIIVIAVAVVGMLVYRNYSYLTVTQVGVYQQFVGEECKSTLNGAIVLRRCDTVTKYPILLLKHWSDTNETESHIKTVSQEKWELLKLSKGYVPVSPEV